MVVRQAVLQERPRDVDALLGAWYDGLHVFQLDTPGAADALARGTDLTPADYEAALAGLRFYSREAAAKVLGGDPPALAAQADGVVDVLTSVGLLRHPPDWKGLVDSAPLARVQTGRQTP